MGYQRHDVIIVTGWNSGQVETAYNKAIKLCSPYVSPIQCEAINGYRSFAIFPDGSKKGWEESVVAKTGRDQFIIWLERVCTHDDGSTKVDWVGVSFGGDGDGAEITDDSRGSKKGLKTISGGQNERS